ncbi:hypothetical protein PI95_021445 [Hassallia byssoidea VB512170]|uniref:Uncharacterized protein n=1 Tax=Hassallia byssoidea VB512170 TaxID=1304833 RepID=A0A846HEK7_9CYAN|nr:hypothetical protein [Hassalia byssoidea]NEU75050.1 hypothetical protein [Hassalia byssoidea VB512170]
MNYELLGQISPGLVRITINPMMLIGAGAFVWIIYQLQALAEPKNMYDTSHLRLILPGSQSVIMQYFPKLIVMQVQTVFTTMLKRQF